MWGQVDAAGSLVLLLALLALAVGRFGLAGALTVLAGMVKPQFGLVVLPVVTVAVMRWRATGSRVPLVRGLLGGVAAYLVVAVPLRLDPITFVGQVIESGGYKQMSSANAANIWGLFHGYRIPDDGLLYVGGALLLIGLAASLLPLRRRQDLATVLEAVPRARQDGSRQVGRFRFGSRRMGPLTAVAALILVAVAGGLAVDRIGPFAFASHRVPSGFSGNWTSLDCATFWEERPDGTHLVDCGFCGDESLQTLQIGHGDSPRVTFQDSYASSCDHAGSLSTRWVGAGTGESNGVWLLASLSKTGCGTYGNGAPVEIQFYYDSGSDTLWQDDGFDADRDWGYVWHRAS